MSTIHARCGRPGAVLARLHEALADYPNADLLTTSSAPPTPLTAQVTGWIDSSRARHVPPAARETLRRWVIGAPRDALPRQLVHGDFRSSNVLFAGNEVAAVIDFEEAKVDHRIVEVARSAVMLGTRFRDWGPVSADVHTAFLAGYQAVRRLTPLEARWWDILILWCTLALVPAGEDPTGWGPSARELAALPRVRRS